jgi:hypothetical protein
VLLVSHGRRVGRVVFLGMVIAEKRGCGQHIDSESHWIN